MDDLKKVQTQPVKSKTVAIVLAVFLSFSSWLYTYEKNKRKFWIGFGVSLTRIASGITAFIVVLRPFVSDIFIKQATGASLANIRAIIGAPGVGLVIWIWVLSLASLGIWIWGIIDNSIRSISFYDDYPN